MQAVGSGWKIQVTKLPERSIALTRVENEETVHSFDISNGISVRAQKVGVRDAPSTEKESI